MRNEEQSQQLLPIPIDYHICNCIAELMEEDEHRNIDWREIGHRNSMVPEQLWHDILYRHLHHFYN